MVNISNNKAKIYKKNVLIKSKLINSNKQQEEYVA